MLARPIDRGRTERLAGALMAEIKRELQHRPPSRDNVLICLNALAFCAAGLLCRHRREPGRAALFDDALTQNLVEIRKVEI
jgi:hypothetical protein